MSVSVPDMTDGQLAGDLEALADVLGEFGAPRVVASLMESARRLRGEYPLAGTGRTANDRVWDAYRAKVTAASD